MTATAAGGRVFVVVSSIVRGGDVVHESFANRTVRGRIYFDPNRLDLFTKAEAEALAAGPVVVGCERSYHVHDSHRVAR